MCEGLGAAGLSRLLISVDAYATCQGGATLLNRNSVEHVWQVSYATEAFVDLGMNGRDEYFSFARA